MQESAYAIGKKAGEGMKKVISIGNQGFDSIREKDCFYIDKTNLIKEWWESEDCITLITRPRRFGKTLNMSMLNCFFSNQYKNRGALFEGLSIWEDEKYRVLQGTYPVIFISFAAVKADNYKDTVNQIIIAINQAYEQHRYMLEGHALTQGERNLFRELDLYVKNASVDKSISADLVCNSINSLSACLQRYYGSKVMIFLDEYDTPLQEAWLHGYWDEITSFIQSLFNASFKTNPHLERAMLTGITRISKESIFSDLNNLRVVTTTCEEYADSFGFTQDEVFASLEEFGLGEHKEEVKRWYDGFTFGSCHDIYNPWSITNYLKEEKLYSFWASTSSNKLVGSLLQTASADVKRKMEELMDGREIVAEFDEQIVFSQMGQKESAIWSLLVASGYLKVEEVEYRGVIRRPWYHLRITNLETEAMFADLFLDWFAGTSTEYNGFVRALLNGNKKEMNIYMNEVAMATFSSFDTGKHPSKRQQPERFYHGFVLGLLVELREEYEVKSNRESGYGRYDVMLIPRDRYDESKYAILLEFKVHEPDEEKNLEETVQAALQQIEDKNYDVKLLEAGIPRKRIRHYGFAFEGKRVLIRGN